MTNLGGGAQGRNRTTDTCIFSSESPFPLQSRVNPAFSKSLLLYGFLNPRIPLRPWLPRENGTTTVPNGCRMSFEYLMDETISCSPRAGNPLACSARVQQFQNIRAFAGDRSG